MAAAPARSTFGESIQDGSAALNATIADGRPTVLIVTSRAHPASVVLRDRLDVAIEAGAITTPARVAELPAELYPNEIEQLAVREFPTLVAYGATDGRLTRLGHLTAPANTAQVARWLDAIGLGGPEPSAERSRTDDALERTGLFDHKPRLVAVPMASPQQPTPAQAAAPAPAAQTPMMAAPQAQPMMAPVVQQQSGPPIIVRQQQPSIYVQPSAPRILLGQAPPPEITIVQGPQAAPTVQYGVAAPKAPQQAPNLFMAPSKSNGDPEPQAGAPSPQSTQPMAAVPQQQQQLQQQVQAYYAMPMAATTTGMALPQAQQSMVATTAIALLLENPDFVSALIGAIGRVFREIGDFLAKFGQPRVRMDRPEATPAAAAMVPLNGVSIAPGQAAYAVPMPQANGFAQSRPSRAAPMPQAAVPSPQNQGGQEFGSNPRAPRRTTKGRRFGFLRRWMHR